MKKISIFALLLTAACQQSTAPQAPAPAATPQIQVTKAPALIKIIAGPASDDAESLDLTLLEEGFPILGEIELTAAPKGCALSKANRFTPARPGETFDGRYVFTSYGDAEQSVFQIGINGELRTFKQTDATDMETKKVRYFKTLEGPEVEIQVVLENDGTGQKGTVGRVKAWDSGIPLMCGYNRIEVIGDCYL